MAEGADYVVVGAGSAGAVVAARLCEAGARVVLVEAGAAAQQREVKVPGLYPALMDTVLDWGFRTEPQAELNGRRIFLTRGRGLGGTSLMNAMVYMRGNRGDYDHWRDLGCAGWSYDEVLPLFMRSENNQRLGAPFHGRAGGLIVSDAPERNPLTAMFLQACAERQMRLNEDMNGAAQEGYGYFQMTADRLGRCHTGRAFLEPVAGAENLRIVTNALVTRVIIEGGRARGVEYVSGSSGHRVMAGAEVILCGGALNSPQLLMLSGVGPAAHLVAHGIGVAVDLPGVGQNLQDHLQVGYRCEVAAPLTNFGMSPQAVEAATARFLATGDGPFASNLCEAGAFLRCDPAAAQPDVQVHFEPDFGADRADGTAADRHGFCMWINASRPRSRGEIRLRSGDPYDKPGVDPRYLSDARDLEVTVDAVLACREIGMAEAFRGVGAREVWPGAGAVSRADIGRFVRAMGSTIWHPAGSCAMGVDARAVVDPALRVRGVAGLRVADASIMPTLVSGNTNAPCIMIGEKAAALVLGSV